MMDCIGALCRDGGNLMVSEGILSEDDPDWRVETSETIKSPLSMQNAPKPSTIELRPRKPEKTLIKEVL